MNLEALKAPFDPAAISWRVGSTTGDKSKGMALAYIDARDVQDRLDQVCGVGGWQCRYPHANGKTVCEIGVRIGDEWIWKADGAGDSDVEAEKGALSDAFKRAAVRWGIGRYLYDLDSPWVALDDKKRIVQSEYARLRALLAGNLGKGQEPKPQDAPKTIASDVNAALKKWQDWAAAAIAAIKKMSPKELSEWEMDNAKYLPALRKADADLHATVLKAMQECDGLKQAAE